jgi:uncharacterized protein (TIGR03437 family)
MPNPLRAAVLALVAAVSHGQQLPFPTFLNPKVLWVGGPESATLFNQSYTAGLTALWNGLPRPTSRNSAGGYTVSLTAADLAAPQLAVLTVVDSQSGAVVDAVNYPVGYNVQPTGIALDRGRNRLYVATPGQSSDSQFPPNSVVAVDLDTGTVEAAVQINSALGDLALSDDGSALYVVVEGNSLVRRFDPTTLTPVTDFNFRPAGYNWPYPNAPVSDMLTVMPGHSETVALWFAPEVGSSGTQIAIYDNGVKRPNVISTCCGFSGILFSPDGKYIFENGTNTFGVTPNAFDYQFVTFRHTVDSTGIPNDKPRFASGGGAAVVSENSLYTSLNTNFATFLATTIDYRTMQVTGNFGVAGPLAVDATNQRAFILYSPPPYSSSGASPPPELVAFTLPSLEPMGTEAIGANSITSLKEAEKLLRFGDDGIIIPSTAGLLIFHTPLAGPAPATTASAVVNTASQQAGAIAPGEILTIHGTNLGPSIAQTAVSSAGVLPSSLSRVEVRFGQLTGTPLLASEGQINVVAPFGFQPGATVDLQVLYYGIPSAKIPLPVVAAAPALFTRDGTGSGPVTVTNQDGTVNTPSPPGSVVTLRGTGGGAFAGAVDGGIARRRVNLSGTVRVSVAGRDAQLLYAGTVPGLVSGIFELDVRLPSDAPSGQAAITVNIEGNDSPNGVTLEIR